MELQLVVHAGDIRELAAEAVERLDDDDVEGAASRLAAAAPIARPVAAGAGDARDPGRSR